MANGGTKFNTIKQRFAGAKNRKRLESIIKTML
jgi:hypothetical protein